MDMSASEDFDFFPFQVSSTQPKLFAGIIGTIHSSQGVLGPRKEGFLGGTVRTPRRKEYVPPVLCQTDMPDMEKTPLRFLVWGPLRLAFRPTRPIRSVSTPAQRCECSITQRGEGFISES